MKMSHIKPLILQWCIDSWQKMVLGRAYIKTGWHSCTLVYYNVHDPDLRQLAVEASAKGEIDATYVPERKKKKKDRAPSPPPEEVSSEDEENEDADVLAVMKARQYGTRKSSRQRSHAQPSSHSYMLSSSQIALSGDSEG